MNLHVTGKNIIMKRLSLWLFFAWVTLWGTSIVPGHQRHVVYAQPIEIGTVRWNRDFDETLKRSAEEDKPVFVLFQEVPGCEVCQIFGRDVLSNRLLVEAIETEFLPLLVYNNRQGEDAEILKKYQEPAWNFQVIRFLNSAGQDIIPRKDRIWTVRGVAQRMGEALQTVHKRVPPYLIGFAQENDHENIDDATFAMHCFWTGEMELGSIEGVVRTEAGYYDGREVTRVWYHKQAISLNELARKVSQNRYADRIYVKSARQIEEFQSVADITLPLKQFDETHYTRARTSDQKKQIQDSLFTKLELTEFQLTKVNAFARTNRDKALEYLSPGQIADLKKLEEKSGKEG